jgi:N-acetyltransferase
MSYTPSQPTDAALHARHHHATSAALSAPELPLLVRRALDAATDATSSSSSAANVVWADGGGEESVVRVTRRDEVGLRRAAERVLRAATLDLGAVDVSAVDLWAERKEVGVEAEGKGGRRERYQVFIFLRRRKCVGLLLAEWISSGFSVVNSGFPIITSNCEGISEADKREHPAMLGISRIWTHRSERRNGVATKLLDAARTGFQPLFVVNKDKVAFSQPTELGASLARKWFGRDEGWLVYRD